MEIDTYKEHRVVWNESKIKRFWNHFSKGQSEEYFSKTLGREVIALTTSHIPLHGKVLDYGCGPGFLVGYLLERGITATGVDFSQNSIDKVNILFKDNSLYTRSLPIQSLPIACLNDGSFDTIFFLETIEHLLPDQIEATIQEIYRLLKPEGYVVVTTQHAESLAKHETICPDCGAIFHRMQHMNSFTVGGMNSLWGEKGFIPVYSASLNFRKKGIESVCKKMYESIMDKIRGRSSKKNLIYIGRKEK